MRMLATDEMTSREEVDLMRDNQFQQFMKNLNSRVFKGGVIVGLLVQIDKMIEDFGEPSSGAIKIDWQAESIECRLTWSKGRLTWCKEERELSRIFVIDKNGDLIPWTLK